MFSITANEKNSPNSPVFIEITKAIQRYAQYRIFPCDFLPKIEISPWGSFTLPEERRFFSDAQKYSGAYANAGLLGKKGFNKTTL